MQLQLLFSDIRHPENTFHNIYNILREKVGKAVVLHFQVTSDEARSIAAITQSQAKSDVWHEERQWRLTSSRFGEIARCTGRRDYNKLCANLFTPPELCTRPILHGRQYESKALVAFTKQTGLEVQKVGLIIDPSLPFLAASPDGLVGTSHTVEVKCPYKAREKMIEPGADFPFITVDMKLSRQHRYFDQVQGQMMLTKRQSCYFVVYTFKDLKVLNVAYDHDYCHLSLLPKLKDFYEKFYRPYVAGTL